MKKTSPWQQLNTSQLTLVFLWLAGLCLVLWIGKAQSDSIHRRDRLIDLKNRVRADVTANRDTLRGKLLNPKHELEKDDKAEEDLDELQKSAAENAELAGAVKNVRDFVLRTLSPFYSRVFETAETDPSGAIAFYNKNSPAIEEQQEKLLNDLEQHVQNEVSARADAERSTDILGVAGIALIVIASVFIIRLQSSAVTKPLSQLVDTLEKMRRGDFTSRLTLDGADDFGVVAEGLNRLADDLSSLVSQVQHSGLQVNTTANQIAATAKEQQDTTSEIAATTVEIGATSKEISATSKELVKTMNEVSHVAEDTTRLASSGQAGISRMEATMHRIMEASGSITGKLAVLSEKTSNINSVVTTITKVADQTNLLSLNAAIEAEKAGEYGLGFAVVAMEIRRLADQTAVATYDIEKSVKEMQSAVAAGVMGMDKFSEEVRRGVEEIRQVSTQLAQIIHQVQTLTPRFQTVNEGMHAQATGAHQISETLMQLSEAAQQTAESLRQSDRAIEQLNEAARGLQSSVIRFKLEN